MKQTLIPLGFEVPTGEPVSVPLYHMAVTGQTQQSGKTTALQALISRAPEVRAVAFKTKRGEIGFEGAREIEPYFQDTAGEGRPYWEFVELLLVSTMKQKMKFERAWTVKAAEGAKNLRDVRANVERLKGEAKRAMDKDLFMLLGEYLDIVLPQLSRMPRSESLSLSPGLNVIDLTEYSDEMQQLVVRSCIEWVHRFERNVVCIIPEAWKFLPETRMTPVKPAAEKLIREGAVLGNFVWMDSQDFAGIWNLALRAATVWLIGVQREANEVTRTLKNIPEDTHKPKRADLMKLKLGEFFACFGETVTRTYVQPAWLGEGEARLVARGELTVGKAQDSKPQPGPQRREETRVTHAPAPPEWDGLATHLAGLTRQLELLNERIAPLGAASVDMDEIVNRVLARLPKPRAAGAVDLDDIASRVLARLPAGGGGVVRVEPKEVVLKRYQEAEVERVLARVEGLTHWQKQVLCLVEAKGAQVEKVDLLRLILGKQNASLVSDYKQRYAEADELAALGFLRKDSKGRLSPNLSEAIKERLSGYHASEAEVEEVIGQILVRIRQS